MLSKIYIQTECMYMEEEMKLKSYYPVIMTSEVSKTADFYCTHFDFEKAFDSDWYIHLISTNDKSVNLAILDGHHETVPAVARGQVSGVILNFEVENVDAEYERLSNAGLEMLLPIRDEAFGQRHFITQDPNGVLLDVIKVIPPTGEYVDQYLDDEVLA
jgi:uncharacterized glyoxalase superfamily protein PhnB